MSKKLTTEEFIKRAKEVHGDKYDYSKVEYKNCDTKVCIICPEHGEFWQTPYNHTKLKQGCPKCANNINYTTEEFIKRAREVHGDKYDYSKVEYINANEKVCIICPEHGEFWQKSGNHLHGYGCPFCKGKNKTTESFIEEVKKIHGDKYDYSKVIYNGTFNPIRIICKKHGEFITTPHNILKGYGCSKCGNEIVHKKQRLSTEQFIEKAKEVHGDKYDYSKVEYVDAKTPVCLICQKHGDFYVIPNKHTSSHKQGCPKCTESSLETKIRILCEKNNIKFEQEKKFPWLGLQRIDFFLPEYSVGIECQGNYHFEPHYTSKENEKYDILLKRIKMDEIKHKLCLENNIKIFYFIPSNLLKYTKISKIYNNENTFYSVEKLFEKIKK